MSPGFARDRRPATLFVILSSRRISQPALAVCEILRELRMTTDVAEPQLRSTLIADAY